MLLRRLSTGRCGGGGCCGRRCCCGGGEVYTVAESHHCLIIHRLTDHLKLKMKVTFQNSVSCWPFIGEAPVRFPYVRFKVSFGILDRKKGKKSVRCSVVSSFMLGGFYEVLSLL